MPGEGMNKELVPGQRDLELEARVKEFYKQINTGSMPMVVSTGAVTVDTDASQTGLFFCTAPGDGLFSYDRASEAYAKFPENLTQDEIRDVFFTMDHAFNTGLKIGMRELMRLAQEHLRIRRQEGRNSTELEALIEAYEAVFEAVGDGADEFIEPVTFGELNPDSVEDLPGRDMKKWQIDLTKRGDGQYLDFRSDPIALLDKLSATAEEEYEASLSESQKMYRAVVRGEIERKRKEESIRDIMTMAHEVRKWTVLPTGE